MSCDRGNKVIDAKRNSGNFRTCETAFTPIMKARPISAAIGPLAPQVIRGSPETEKAAWLRRFAFEFIISLWRTFFGTTGV
jgi:hypothetical protein